MSKYLWCRPSCPVDEQTAILTAAGVEEVSTLREVDWRMFDTVFNPTVVSGTIVDRVADFFKALEDYAYTYNFEGCILPSDPVFLSNFFLHAGIEYHTDAESFRCILLDADNAVHTITILV